LTGPKAIWGCWASKAAKLLVPLFDAPAIKKSGHLLILQRYRIS
jgi:hypothetical protein